MPINVFNQENSYFMFLIITLGLNYKTMLTIETQKAYNKNNTSCFQENTGISLPLGRPPGRALRLRLRALPDGLPRGNNIPYFPESMKYYYIILGRKENILENLDY